MLLFATFVTIQRQDLRSKEKLHAVRKRQLIYFIVINFIEMPFLLLITIVRIFIDLYGGNSSEVLDLNTSIFATICLVIFFSRGILVPFLRLTEPAFWAQFKRVVTRRLSRQNSLKESDPNVVFLTSVQNNMTVSGILKGIQIAMADDNREIQTTLKKPDIFKFDSIEIIDQADFRYRDHRRSEKLKSIPSNAIIKSYGQQIFKQLRQLQGIQEQEIMESLKPESNRLQIFKTNKDMIKGISTNKGGKSDSFFFFTED